MKLESANKDCETCKSEFCLPECFNIHPGSMIALQKLLKECGMKKEEVHITGDI